MRDIYCRLIRLPSSAMLINTRCAEHVRVALSPGAVPTRGSFRFASIVNLTPLLTVHIAAGVDQLQSRGSHGWRWFAKQVI